MRTGWLSHRIFKILSIWLFISQIPFVPPPCFSVLLWRFLAQFLLMGWDGAFCLAFPVVGSLAMDLNCSVQNKNHQRGSGASPRSVECCVLNRIVSVLWFFHCGMIFPPYPSVTRMPWVDFCLVSLIQVQYNLLTPPIGWVSGSQDSSRRTSVPLYHGFKEVEENWTKHCSSGKNENVRNVLFQGLPL